MSDLIPVTKKGNSSFRGLATQDQIDAQKGKLVPIDMAKFAADAAAADEKKAAADAKKAEEKAAADAAKPAKDVKPADIKRSPAKGD